MKISLSKSEIKGMPRAPSSKSYTIRGLMCAALAKGQSELVNPLTSDDTQAALRVLSQTGVKSDLDQDAWHVHGDCFHTPSEDLDCGESAATLRFMAAICSVVPGKCRLTAGPSLAKRPVKPLVEALKGWGADISCEGDLPPVSVTGGGLKGGLTELPGDISSQFVSALLLVAPFCKERSRIQLTTPLESVPYVLMTLECLQKFGIKVTNSGDLREYEISPQLYQAARYLVEADWSSASYLLALAAVAGEIKLALQGDSLLNMHSLQGDKAIADLLRKMGASVEISPEYISVKKRRLKAITADLNDCIDLLPTMAVLASLAEGTSVFSGIKRARLKESNRIMSIKQGLERAGIQVTEGADELRIAGGKPGKATIASQNDHRISMAFSIMGAAAGGIIIDGAECVSKTYPEYWDTLRSLGVKADEQ